MVPLKYNSYYFCTALRRLGRSVLDLTGVVMSESPQVDEAEEYLFAATTTGDVVKVRLNKSSKPGESLSCLPLLPASLPFLPSPFIMHT